MLEYAEVERLLSSQILPPGLNPNVMFIAGVGGGGPGMPLLLENTGDE